MPSFKKFISGKPFLFLGSALLVFILAMVFRQWRQKYVVQKEINDLSVQASSLQQKNQDLQNLLQYLQTTDYKQEAAREQLNLQRSGEVVYNFSAQGQSGQAGQSGQGGQFGQDGVSAAGAGNAGAAADAAGQNVSDAQKWWNYFFKH